MARPPHANLLVAALSAATLSACATAPAPALRAGRYAGRTVVVTGASSGFGRGVALSVGAQGGSVVLAARRADLLEEVAAEIRASGGRALAVPTDVSDPAQMARLAETAAERFGRIDVWVNDAGVIAIGRFDQTPAADHARVVDVNLKGVIFGSHEAMRRFRAQHSGVLINVGSVESKLPLPYQASYVATKHAVLGLDQALIQELRAGGERDVHVVTVMPWAADTPIWDHAGNSTGRETRAPMVEGPDPVVRAVVDAGLRPRPVIAVGARAKGAVLAHQWLPGLTETVAGGVYNRVQMEQAPGGVAPNSGTLHAPEAEGRTVDGGVRARWKAEDAARRPR